MFSVPHLPPLRSDDFASCNCGGAKFRQALLEGTPEPDANILLHNCLQRPTRRVSSLGHAHEPRKKSRINTPQHATSGQPSVLHHHLSRKAMIMPTISGSSSWGGQPQQLAPRSCSYEPCSQCAANTKTFICIQCNNLAFCEACWPTWVLHVDGATGWGGRPHEKADPHVITRLREILEPSTTDADHDRNLELDDDTTWFGVVRDASHQHVFQDYGRFAALMGESQSDYDEDRYPQLVSFIGQTGKSHTNVSACSVLTWS